MTSSTRTLVRRLGTLSAASLSVLVLLSAPALADIPSGWAPNTHANGLHFLALVLLIPGGLALVIAGLVLLPGILKGEGLLPKAHPKSDAPTHSGH